MAGYKQALALLGRNLFQGIRGAFFFPIQQARLCATWSQFIGLVALMMVIQVCSDVLRIGVHGEFSLYGLPGTLFDIPVILFAAWVFARSEEDSSRTLELTIAFTAIAIPVKILHTVLLPVLEEKTGQITSPSLGYLIEHADALWLAMASGIAAVRTSSLSRARRVLASFSTAFIIAFLLSSVYRTQNLWTYQYDEEESKKRWEQRNALNDESVFYVQPKLLERELGALKPGPSDRTNLYFLGVAGYAEQDVFMKEVRYVGKLLDERYGMQGRAIELINNPKTAAETPIASVSSIRAALQHLGGVMNRDKDVLFLYLTSHGSKDHHFSLDFGDMRFKQLDPAMLRALLDESGIKRRIVVISACYSGGFVDALKSDDTLVITAAAPDKQSFGCSNEADFTYFGKAYFAEALQKTGSFTDAFSLASAAIFEREKEEQQDHADPRMFVGANIKTALAELTPARSTTAAQTLPKHESDSFTRHVDLLKLPEYVAHLRRVCLEQMDNLSPSTVVKREPDAYGGLNDRSHQWNRLMAAWQEYAEQYCVTQTDPDRYRTAYLQAWRETASDAQIEKATEFYLSPFGKQLLATQQDVDNKVVDRLTRAQFAEPDNAAKRFEDERNAAIADYQRDKDAEHSRK